MPKATIAVIEGRVGGGGSELALSCDMRFAAIGRATCSTSPRWPSASCPGARGTVRLARLIGRSRTMEVVLGCDDVDAELAERWGWVNRALPPGRAVALRRSARRADRLASRRTPSRGGQGRGAASREGRRGRPAGRGRRLHRTLGDRRPRPPCAASWTGRPDPRRRAAPRRPGRRAGPGSWLRARPPGYALRATGLRHLAEEVVALVVDDDEGGEVDDLDLPDRLHAELGVLEHLDLGDAVLGQPRRRAADRAEVEAAVLLAGVGDGLGAVALGQHHEAAAGGLELVDVGVHAARRWWGRTSPRRSPPASWPGRRSRRSGPAGTAAAPSPASSRSLILAWAMSRATTIGPVSDSRVLDRVAWTARRGSRPSAG